jgi:hypothetical protein
MTGPELPDAASDAEFLRELLARTRRRIDPHAFHFVWWGAIVIVWYPLTAWLQARGWTTAALGVGIGSLLLGVLGSVVLEARLRGRSRLPGEDSAVGDRVGRVVAGNIAAGAILSVVAPATGFVAGPMVPVLWGLVYASLAFHVGILYSREFTWSGAFILVGTCVSMALGPDCPYLLGPVMGLGMIVPGLLAERRVRSMRREDALDAATAA